MDALFLCCWGEAEVSGLEDKSVHERQRESCLHLSYHECSLLASSARSILDV